MIPVANHPSKIGQQQVDRIGKNTDDAVAVDLVCRNQCENDTVSGKQQRQLLNNRVHTRCLSFFENQEKSRRKKKKEYPTIPHTGTGTPNNMEYGLCETVSQFNDRDMAQKLS